MFFSRKPVKPSAEASNIAEKLSVLESIYTTQAVAEFSPEGMVLSANTLYHDMFGCADGSLMNRPHKTCAIKKTSIVPNTLPSGKSWRLALWLTASSVGRKPMVKPSGWMPPMRPSGTPEAR